MAGAAACDFNTGAAHNTPALVFKTEPMKRRRVGGDDDDAEDFTRAA
jgi:hypothetical protein